MLGRLRGIRNSAWAVLEYGWSPLLVFTTTPYFLRTLGSIEYGHWMLMTATVLFGALLNVGTGPATIKLVSDGIGRDDWKAVDHAVRSALTVALVGGGLIALLIFTVFWFAGDVLFAKMGDQGLLRLTAAFAAVLAWLEQVTHVFASALKGAERFQRAATLEIVLKTAQILGAASVLSLGGGLMGAYTAMVVVAVLRLTTNLIVARRSLGFSVRPVLSGVADVLYFAKWGWVQAVGGLLSVVADRMIVAAYLGATDLAHYSIAVQLTQQIHALPAAALSVLFPVISRRRGHPDFSLRKVAKTTLGWNLVVSTVLALGLILCGNTILGLWVGRFPGAMELITCLSVSYWLLSITVAGHYVLLGLGRIRLVSLTNLVAGVATLLAMALLVRSFGLNGLAISRSAYGAVCLVNVFAVWKLVAPGVDRRDGAS